MARDFYDIVIVGGGIGGSALAKTMAEDGYRTLVVERESIFRDRVRGEGLHAWGIPEAKTLGIYDTLLARCAVEARWWDIYLGTDLMARRNFPETTPHSSPLLAFSHPEMQETLLEAAAKAGATIWRGARVQNVLGGAVPVVSVARNEWSTEVQARLVVGADGRNSPTRRWGEFHTKRDPAERLFTGVLLKNVDVPPDTWIAHMNPLTGMEAMVCNIGKDRVRAYLGHPRTAGYRIAKSRDFPEFVRGCVEAGAPAGLYAGATIEGPIASFATEDLWVEHPYSNGIALLGDAASTCDPSFGQGMALTLRGVRILRDLLVATADWDEASHVYAEQQHQQFQKIRTIEGWYRTMFLDRSDDANNCRARSLPMLAAEPTRDPDLFGLGPDAPADEFARQRFFAEV